MKISKTTSKFLLISGIFLVVVGGLFFAVWVMTRPALIDDFTISEKNGEIGDAVNGITAPITSLIGSILIYLSLSAQVKANSLIQSQWNYDTFVRVFNDIQAEYSNLKYTAVVQYGLSEPQVSVTYYGSEAISNFILYIKRDMNQPQIGILNDLSFILEDLRALIEDADKSDIPIERKLFILHRINRYYTAKIQIQINQIKNKLEANPKFYTYHISTINAIDLAVENFRRKYITGVSQTI